MGQPTQDYLGHLTFDPLLVPALHPRCSLAFAECVTWLFAHEVLHAEVVCLEVVQALELWSALTHPDDQPVLCECAAVAAVHFAFLLA